MNESELRKRVIIECQKVCDGDCAFEESVDAILALIEPLQAEKENYKIALIEIRDTLGKDGRFTSTAPEIDKVLNGEGSETIDRLKRENDNLRKEVARLNDAENVLLPECVFVPAKEVDRLKREVAEAVKLLKCELNYRNGQYCDSKAISEFLENNK